MISHRLAANDITSWAPGAPLNPDLRLETTHLPQATSTLDMRQKRSIIRHRSSTVGDAGKDSRRCDIAWRMLRYRLSY
jgi:hypothetical protein